MFHTLCGFEQQKSEFIKQLQQAGHHGCDDAAADDSAVSAEQLSEFYKQFLDDNYELHHNYNRSAFYLDNQWPPPKF